MSYQTNRTFICSVVFVDLVGYSRRPVSEQLAVKDRFTALLGDALKDVAVNDRIVLDTGDGAAMSFLGDPEDALFVGMSLRDALKSGETLEPGDAPPTDMGGIRIGINLGPVKLVKDINGHPNIVGDGINVAQRIMSFAEPGQVLVSRSYYDVVSCMSEEYGKLFSYDGSRTDKHVRDHDVYVVGESESAFTRARDGMERRATGSGPKPALQQAAADSARSASAPDFGQAVRAFLRNRRKVAIAGAALGAVVLLLGGLLVARKPATPHVPSAVARGRAIVPSPETVPLRTMQDDAAKKDPSRPLVAPGSVNLLVTPWGEIFINGRSRGLSPPMKTLKLAPGKYKIEIRNSGLAPYTGTIEIRSREEITLRHAFK